MVLDLFIDITSELIGEDASRIVEFLHHNPKVSEFVISEEINFPVNIVRSLLYKLKEKNLIDCDRKKDKKKGWYLYYWFLVPENFEKTYKLEKKNKIHQFKERLDDEQSEIFYICPNFCKRVNFDSAISQNFSCEECGELLNEENRERKVKMLKRNIEEHEKIISSNILEDKQKEEEENKKN